MSDSKTQTTSTSEEPVAEPEASVAETLAWLDPESLTFHWAGGSAPVHVTVGEERTVLRVQAVRAFPRTDPNGFVQLHESGKAGRGKVVGMIESLAPFMGANREALAECLRRGSVVPRVTRIVNLEERRDLVRWVVETDRGPTSFDMDKPYDNVKRLPSGDVVLTDAVKNRYEVDPRSLDPGSLSFLERYA